MSVRFGVDEAGKGPVFGPMVVAAVACSEEDLPEGVRDSKRLTPTRRKNLARKLLNNPDIQTHTVHVTPEQIDEPDSNLNTLTVQAHGEAVDGVATDGMDGTADACDTDTTRYTENLLSNTETDVTVDGRHKADDYDPIVSAASIIAKVERDGVIEEIREEYGDIGSGYPSDQTTRDFLETYYREHGEFPPFARLSWKTCQKITAAGENHGLSDF